MRKPGVTEGFPFGEDTLVFKVKEKIFVLANLDGDLSLNLKCDPVFALELRERFASVTPGYHMNKRHWNTVIADNSIPEGDILWMIDHSYILVFDELKKNEKEKILKTKPAG